MNDLGVFSDVPRGQAMHVHLADDGAVPLEHHSFLSRLRGFTHRVCADGAFRQNAILPDEMDDVVPRGRRFECRGHGGSPGMVSKGTPAWKRITASALSFGLVTLAGCGGGSLPLESGSLPDSGAAAPRYSYTPYISPSNTHTWTWGDVREVFIGGDHEPRERLRHITTQNGIQYYIGASRDGVGVARLENYETDLQTQDGEDPRSIARHGFRPFSVRPTLYLDAELFETQHRDILNAIVDSIEILNDALPPEFQIDYGGMFEGTYFRNQGDIHIDLASAQNIQSACNGGIACARWQNFGSNVHAAVVYLPSDLDTSQYTYPRKVVLHEMLHALGIQGHVDTVEFPDSIMGSFGEYIPNLGHIISRIDREVLQIMYMSQRTDLYNDWGEWSDTTHHMLGRTEDDVLNFGVALFNGLPQPWVRGDRPNVDLADNSRLLGTATWEGSLVAFSGPSPLAGIAELEVNLNTLAVAESEHGLRFRDIYYVNRLESSEADVWFSTRNIDYKVIVDGNYFANVRGAGQEQGLVAGAFLGAEHEHMGGTVKRTDMVGAFGGSR